MQTQERRNEATNSSRSYAEVTSGRGFVTKKYSRRNKQIEVREMCKMVHNKIHEVHLGYFLEACVAANDKLQIWDLDGKVLNVKPNVVATYDDKCAVIHEVTGSIFSEYQVVEVRFSPDFAMVVNHINTKRSQDLFASLEEQMESNEPILYHVIVK